MFRNTKLQFSFLFYVFIFLLYMARGVDIASSSIICAKSIGRNDLYFLAVILSAFGNAIGTFIGIFAAEIFRMFF